MSSVGGVAGKATDFDEFRGGGVTGGHMKWHGFG